MRLLDRLRSWIWKAEETANEVEYAALEQVHRAEDRVDEATGGRFYDTLERADEEADELLERAHLEGLPDGEPTPAEPETNPPH